MTVTLPELQRDEGTGLYLRVGRGEEGVVKEQRSYYRTLPLERARCLDLGAHVGCFVQYAFERDAAEVISVEPEPESFAILQLNTRGADTILYNAAVMNDEAPAEVPFYLYRTFSSMNSLFGKRGRTEITVPTIRLSDLLAWPGPDVLKIDIEGGEYGLAGILGELPPCVKAVAVEFHFLSDPSFLAQAEAMVASFLASGFTEVRAAPLTKTHWRHHYAALGCYVR